MEKMHDFVKLPSVWLHDGRLETFRWPKNVGELKALLGLAVLRGRFERAATLRTGSFPVTLADLCEFAHVNRNTAGAALRALEARRIVLEGDREGLGVRLPPRTRVFRFAEETPAWVPVPYRRIHEGALLKRVAPNSYTGFAAMKMLLILLGCRNTQTWESKVSYDRLERERGLHRNKIRAGASLLIQCGLLHAFPREERREPNTYFVLGLGDRTPTVRQAEEFGNNAAEDFSSYLLS